MGFLDSYIRYCGQSEIPAEFNRWAGISLLAAAMSDNVWFEKVVGQRLVPNLYVVLVGPSGLGKGAAINRALGLVKGTPLEQHVYSGKTSGQFLADRLAGRSHEADDAGVPLPQVWMPKTVRDACGRLFLVTEELGLAVGSGPLADGFVKYMTGLYGGSPLPFSDGTRTRGEVKVASYCVNWLAGSTEEWLIRSISQDAIEGGFFGRTVVVGAKYNLDQRIVRPVPAPDHERLEAVLRQQLSLACRIRGEFVLSGLAAEAEKTWYETRPVPVDERLLPGWKRQHDLVLKLAMVLAMSDYLDDTTRRLQIDSGHMIDAQRLAALSHQPLPRLIAVSAAIVNKAMRPIMLAERFLQKHKVATHRRLCQHFGSAGLTAAELAGAIHTLIEQHKVEIEKAGPKGAKQYRWAAVGHRFKVNGHDDDEGVDSGDVVCEEVGQ